MSQLRVPAVVLLTLLAGHSAVSESRGLALGQPRKLAIVLEQLPLGIQEDAFPDSRLSRLAEDYLRSKGLTILPRDTLGLGQPYLQIRIVGIRQAAGYVYLVEGDLRETLPASCTGGARLEVSTWQHRQWISAEVAGRPTPDLVWGVLERILRAFVSQDSPVRKE